MSCTLSRVPAAAAVAVVIVQLAALELVVVVLLLVGLRPVLVLGTLCAG